MEIHIGDKIEAVVSFEVDRLERENGVTIAAGRVVTSDGKKHWTSLPLENCKAVQS